MKNSPWCSEGTGFKFIFSIRHTCRPGFLPAVSNSLWYAIVLRTWQETHCYEQVTPQVVNSISFCLDCIKNKFQCKNGFWKTLKAVCNYLMVSWKSCRTAVHSSVIRIKTSASSFPFFYVSINISYLGSWQLDEQLLNWMLQLKFRTNSAFETLELNCSHHIRCKVWQAVQTYWSPCFYPQMKYSWW